MLEYMNKDENLEGEEKENEGKKMMQFKIKNLMMSEDMNLKDFMLVKNTLIYYN